MFAVWNTDDTDGMDFIYLSSLLKGCFKILLILLIHVIRVQNIIKEHGQNGLNGFCCEVVCYKANLKSCFIPFIRAIRVPSSRLKFDSQKRTRMTRMGWILFI